MSIILDEQAGTIVLETSTGASTQQLSDLPAAGTIDGNDTIPVCVDGVWSLGAVDDVVVSDGSTKANLTGGNTFSGDQTWDNGSSYFLMDDDGTHTRFGCYDGSNNVQIAVANGVLTFSTDIFIYRAAAGQLAFLLGRIVPTVTATTGNAPTWNSSSCQRLVVTSITGAINIGTNMTLGTVASGEVLWVSLTGNGTHAITWGSNFEASGNVALPTALGGSGVRLDVQFIYNTATSKWRCQTVA